jgi:hypothetical protein
MEFTISAEYKCLYSTEAKKSDEQAIDRLKLRSDIMSITSNNGDQEMSAGWLMSWMESL